MWAVSSPARQLSDRARPRGAWGWASRGRRAPPRGRGGWRRPPQRWRGPRGAAPAACTAWMIGLPWCARRLGSFDPLGVMPVGRIRPHGGAVSAGLGLPGTHRWSTEETRMETQRPNWLAGQDFTTFANERRPSGNQVSPDPPQRAARTGRADALVFLAAVWLVIASVSVAYQSTGRFDVLWNDAVVGIAVGVVTVTRLAGAAMPATAAVNCALGAWLVVAPFVLGYGGGGAGRLSLWNDLAVGIVIVALTLATMATATARAATAKAPGPKSPEVEPHRRP